MVFSLVGVPGIEPGLHPPHGRVLPVYYTPKLIYYIRLRQGLQIWQNKLYCFVYQGGELEKQIVFYPYQNREITLEFVRSAYRNNPGVFLDFRYPDGQQIETVTLTPSEGENERNNRILSV